MNILITVCARGGSKGIPGKNIKLIAGKPLIKFSIDLAKKFQINRSVKIGLSTDCNKIKLEAAKCGLTTDYIRPNYLATDNAGKLDAIIDLIKYEESKVDFKYDLILDLDVTSPLRSINDIENALKLLLDTKDSLNIFSVNDANRNPYFNMVEKNINGFYSLSKTDSHGSSLTRQLAPKVFELNASFYWYKRSFFEMKFKTAISDKSLIYLMDHLCFDIDHLEDFLYMEYLLENNKLDFKL
jgi:CMP-N,N'-diacetyllegionaminic acid synthase